MKKEKSKKKRKFKLGGLFLIVLIMYLLFSFGYFLYKLPIKHVEIVNNYYLTDDYIIDLLKIKNSNFLTFSTYSARKKLNKEDLVVNSSIKKTLNGGLKIDVNEEKILFYNWNNKKIVLANDEVKYDEKYLGVPSLINYVPDKIYHKLVKKFNLLDRNILSMISEIEYSPDRINDVVIDENRFLIRMNDGIKIYVNIYNIKKLNNYLEIYDAILKNNTEKTGCLYLDSNSKNYVYGSCTSSSPITTGDEGNEG